MEAFGEHAAGHPGLPGRVCYATTRLIVDRHRHDAFVEALAAAFGSTRVGDPLDPATEMGPVISADGEDDAVAKAKDTVYGLNASVYTDDVERACSVARRLRSGTVGHNGPRTDGTIAFGGFKQSGIGREGGTEGLRAYLEPKTVLLDAAPQRLG
ncbi:aldehyde dehydrogenase family protein [Streptomyces sp. NPDC008092]|uniref:aldehyde dehydrogenase family protein n=1 Tax=Streptomyces sp. NPDC008092 TaxID=3364808 RepID=UPI0036E7C8F2